MNAIMDLDETSCDGQSCLGSKCLTRFIAFKIKHTICDKLGCDLYLRGVNVLVIIRKEEKERDSVDL